MFPRTVQVAPPSSLSWTSCRSDPPNVTFPLANEVGVDTWTTKSVVCSVSVTVWTVASA